VIALAFILRQGQFELTIDVRLGGGVTSLFGPSGAGKTTILDAIAGLRRPVSGTIALGNRMVFSSDQRLDLPPISATSATCPRTSHCSRT
jgi:molybdate transport system ATP-binding protein